MEWTRETAAVADYWDNATERCLWKREGDGWYGDSSCGQGVKYTSEEWRYCPYCGKEIKFETE